MKFVALRFVNLNFVNVTLVRDDDENVILLIAVKVSILV